MTAEEMWETYRLMNPQIEEKVVAWQFGAEADLLADLVLGGGKTATASAYDLYALAEEALPTVGEQSVILNGQEEAVCVIETTKVEVLPFNQVSETMPLKKEKGTSRWLIGARFMKNYLANGWRKLVWLFLRIAKLS